MDVLTLLLPVIWAAAATGIGALLYRSSRALFESSRVTQRGQRRIRLTGSVVIAALAFYGMRAATPSARLQSIPENATVIDRPSMDAIRNLVVRSDRLSLELLGIIEANDTQTAKATAQQLREEIVALKRHVQLAKPIRPSR